MKIWIYQIRNKVNNKIYIGSTNNLKRRWESHIYQLKNNIHHSIKLQKAWNKYGEDNFEFSIIEEFNSDNEDDKYIKEQYYLDLYESYTDKGYNMSNIADTRKLFKRINSENTVFTKITKEVAIAIKRELCETDKQQKEIAEEFGVSLATVNNIARIRTWANYGVEYNEVLKDKLKERKAKHGYGYLSQYEDKVLDMYFNKGMTHTQIANELGISRNNCSEITKMERMRMEGHVRECECCGEDFIQNWYKNKRGKKVYAHQQKYCNKCAKGVDRKKSKERQRKRRKKMREDNNENQKSI